MFENIYKILEEFLGPSKQGNYDRTVSQYQFNCPRCAEEHGEQELSKFNLEVKLDLSGCVFKCWKCSTYDDEMSGKLSKLIKNYGGHELYKHYKDEIRAIRDTQAYELGDLSGLTENLTEEQYIRLPKTFKRIDISSCKDTRLLEYLQKRKIDQNFIDKYTLGTTSWEEEDYSMRNRIIIPSYDAFGDLNYYLGRDYTGRSRLKYKNCDANKQEIIFQESLIDWDSTIYLCEGSFDAMRFPCNGISMLGKTLSRDSYLFKRIVEKANADIVIVLDGDTNEIETKKIYKLLNFGRLSGKIKYLDLWNGISKYKDMSEIYENEGKLGVINVLKHVKQYNEIDLIF